jgi:hypothetical protein
VNVCGVVFTAFAPRFEVIWVICWLSWLKKFSGVDPAEIPDKVTSKNLSLPPFYTSFKNILTYFIIVTES